MIRLTPTAARAAGLLMSLAVLAGCTMADADERSHAGQGQVAEGDIGRDGWSPASLTEVEGIPIASLRSAVQQRLGGKQPGTVGDEAWQHTKRLYGRFQQSPLWFEKGGLDKDRVEALTTALLDATSDGLRIDDYPIAELARAVATVRESKQPTPEQLADADVLLTTAYVSLGEDLLVGQVSPKAIGQAWHIDARDENVDSALVRTLVKQPLAKAINAMRPGDEEYAALQKALGRYRELVGKGGWKAIPAGKPLKRGQSDSPARIAALRARLEAEGISVPAPSTPAQNGATSDGASAATTRAVFDDGLAAAIATFQARHAINVDSALGKETLDALNVPAEYRLGQIAANLERHRWMPRALGTRYIYVNVPAFHLTAYDKGEPALEMKVIVGEEYEDKATPVFSDSMETVVFRPYWNVTPDIQAKEIEPKLAANPGYLAANDMEYWNDGGARRIRQRPGPKNSLGFVKFLFPNDFNIYLHDTPAPELFDKDVRAFSHGCIRVEKPAELAQWVLGWDGARVEQAMREGNDNRSVKLPKKIPVYIAYGTAYFRDGQLHFGNDLYHRDDQLVKAIAEGAVVSSRAVQAVDALRRVATK
ncbi:MAG TPA: L,D-transpeptidase family protein [Gemmatimonadaceae bacterium]|nr:L,D-transpeptidase family protein [Gemmatimonadaceae bacterium]